MISRVRGVGGFSLMALALASGIGIFSGSSAGAGGGGRCDWGEYGLGPHYTRHGRGLGDFGYPYFTHGMGPGYPYYGPPGGLGSGSPYGGDYGPYTGAPPYPDTIAPRPGDLAGPYNPPGRAR
jgi:hypothetical protein